ncbi:hypothetical protein DYB26_004424 [Aphanomyces astaci]|uniref:RWD domain-containing protein n=1 Tax=Aphanomyces astaci TaxID=112090 RepID=A0A3R7B605_APHAT|nr:hypothetical protein DYB26_004424 [Aphanomyces astaci]
MGRTSSLTEWAHFVKTSHKASTSYWWVYCRHCVLAAMAAAAGDQSTTNQPPAKAMHDFVDTMPVPTAAAAASTTDAEQTLHPLVGRRSVMKAHLAHCIHATPMPSNPIVKRRAGKRGVHCAIAEWAHFHRLEKEGYIGNTNYFPVVCKYCTDAYDTKTRPTPPDVFTGRKESMRRHLAQCQHFTGNLPDKAAKPTASKSLSEWEFFVQLDRQPGSMYHFAKCKSCTEAHAANPDQHPEPKIILGRKHNMQTHLANCHHMHHLRNVMDDIAFSSDEDDEARDEDLQISGTPPASPRDVDPPKNEALIHFTIEHNLPFSWVESKHMQVMVPSRLPSSHDLSTSILHSVQRRLENEQRASSRQTLIIEALPPAPTTTTTDQVTTSYVAWLIDAHRVAVPQWMPGQETLTWTCQDRDLASVAIARINQNADTIVAIVLPWSPLPSSSVTMISTHPSVSHVYCHQSVGPIFYSIMHSVLQDDMVTRVLRMALTLAPLPTSCLQSNWAPWLHLVNQQRSHHYPLELDFWHQLDSVGSLLSSLSLANGLARVNTLSLAHTVHLLGDVYLRNQGLNRTTLLQLKLERELERHWLTLEQPLMVLAYVLHPEFQGHVALHPRRTKLTTQALGDVAVLYYSKFFQEPPRTLSLANDVMAFVEGRLSNVSNAASTDGATFSTHLSATYPDLVRLMQRLLDIIPSFCLDNGHLSAHHYTPDEWQNIKYIAYCAPPSPRHSQVLEDIRDVDELLLKWRSQGLVESNTTNQELGGTRQDLVPKVTLMELFGSRINSMASYLFVIIVGSEQNLKQQYAIRMNRQDEVAAFQKLMPASAIESCSPEQLQASIQYTRYRKLRLRLRFPDNYPNEELVIELMSDTLPDVALRRLTKFVDAKASELAKLGQPQVQAVVELIQSSLADNKLLYANDEVRQLRLLAEQNGGEIKLNERAGRIKLLLRHRGYVFHGYTADQALFASNPLKKPLRLVDAIEDEVRLD